MVARLRGYSDASSLERFLVPDRSSSAPVMGSMSLSGGGVMIARKGQNLGEKLEVSDKRRFLWQAARVFSTGEIVV